MLEEYIIEALQIEDEKTILKYKNGLRIEAGNDIISLNKRDRAYMIYRVNKDTLKMYKPLKYQSLDGVKNFMLKTYNVELI